MKQLTFSQTFPAYHPKKGKPTFFVEQIYNAIGFKIGVTKQSGDIPEVMWSRVNDFVLLDGKFKKVTTIRNHAKHLKPGEYFKPMVWAGKPYRKTENGLWQIQFAPPIQVKKTWRLDIEGGLIYINKQLHCYVTNIKMLTDFAQNDGLNPQELLDWFKYPKQDVKDSYIICWNDNINY